MIKAILFDLDGTLIDSESHYVSGTIDWLKKLGINVLYDDVCKIIGMTEEDTYSYISNLSKLPLQKVIDENNNYFYNVNPLVFKKLIFNDVKTFIKELHEQGYILCICSMSPKKYIADFIKDCGLEKYITSFYSGEECTYTKPNPEIYNKVISNLKLNKKEVLIIEDATSGLKAAKDSGAYVVARNDAKFGLNQDDALYIFEDLKELHTIIIEINNGKFD